MDIRAMLIQMRQDASDRRISRTLKIHRQTVKSYRQWAEAQGLLTGDLSPIEKLQRLAKETLSDLPAAPKSILGGVLPGAGGEAALRRCGDRRHLAAVARTRPYRQLCCGVALCPPSGADHARGHGAGGNPAGRGGAGGLRLRRRDDRPGRRQTPQDLGLCDDPVLESPPICRVCLRPESGHVNSRT